MQATWNIAKTGVNFADSLTVCNIYKINTGTKQPIRGKPGKTDITDRLQLVSTDLLGSGIPAARVDYQLIAMYSNH